MIFISSLLSAWNELMKFSQRLQKMELSLLSLSQFKLGACCVELPDVVSDSWLFF